jgi:RNA recognition motif-containing protein
MVTFRYPSIHNHWLLVLPLSSPSVSSFPSSSSSVSLLYRDVRPGELDDAFRRFGRLARVDCKNGYAFVEYHDDRDAEAAVRSMDGREFIGRRIRVEGSRPPSERGPPGEGPPRSGGEREGGYRRDGGDRRGPPPGRDRYDDRRGGGGRFDDRRGGPRGRFDERRGGRDRNGPKNRLSVTGLHPSTTWKDLKDFARQVGEVEYTNVQATADGTVGTIDFIREDDMRYALTKLEGTTLKGEIIHVQIDVSIQRSNDRGNTEENNATNASSSSSQIHRHEDARRSRSRSRSPRQYHSENGDRTYPEEEKGTVEASSSSSSHENATEYPAENSHHTQDDERRE